MDDRVSSERACEIHGELVFAAQCSFLADNVEEETLTRAEVVEDDVIFP